MKLSELLNVLTEEQFISVRVDGVFFYSEQGSPNEIRDGIADLDGYPEDFEVRSIEKGYDDLDLHIEARS